MDWKEVANAAVLYAMALVIMVVLSFVGKALTAWLDARKKAEEADANLSDETDKSMFLSMVEDMIDTAVNAAGQVLVAGIKGTEAWTEQAKAQALEMVKDQVKLVLGEDGMEKLAGWLNDVEVWMVNKIEAAVLKNKGKWAGPSMANAIETVDAKMEKMLKDIMSEGEAEEAEVKEKTGYPTVSLAADSSLNKRSRETEEISDAAYEAATYEGTV